MSERKLCCKPESQREVFQTELSVSCTPLSGQWRPRLLLDCRMLPEREREREREREKERERERERECVCVLSSGRFTCA